MVGRLEVEVALRRPPLHRRVAGPLGSGSRATGAPDRAGRSLDVRRAAASPVSAGEVVVAAVRVGRLPAIISVAFGWGAGRGWSGPWRCGPVPCQSRCRALGTGAGAVARVAFGPGWLHCGPRSQGRMLTTLRRGRPCSTSASTGRSRGGSPEVVRMIAGSSRSLLEDLLEAEGDPGQHGAGGAALAPRLHLAGQARWTYPPSASPVSSARSPVSAFSSARGVDHRAVRRRLRVPARPASSSGSGASPSRSHDSR